MIRIGVSHENAGLAWWPAAQAAITTCPDETLKNLVRHWTHPGVFEVDADTAAQFRAWCESLPGWADGPEWAPHPLIFQAEATV